MVMVSIPAVFFFSEKVTFLYKQDRTGVKTYFINNLYGRVKALDIFLAILNIFIYLNLENNISVLIHKL